MIAKILSNASLATSASAADIFFDERTVKTLLDLISNKPNIKARIQAINALLAYRSIEHLGGP